MVKRCDPTEATTKTLYGSAMRCGKPECTELLYERSEHGGRVRNSTIAHIHAATPNGPRPMVPFDCDAVRSFENLILLCLKHGSEVDQYPDACPVETLREWKQAQLDEADSLSFGGWQLDEEELGEVLSNLGQLQPVAVSEAAALAMAASELRSVALGERASAEQVSLAWDRLHQRAANSLLAWDSNGERIHALPPQIDRDALQTELAATLARSAETIDPHSREVRARGSAVVAVLGPVSTPFSTELEACLDDVVHCLANWPADLQGALDALEAAVGSLCALARGETVAPPAPRVPEPVAEPSEAEAALDRLGQRVSELLEAAAPHSRINTREPDLDLALELQQTMAELVDIPPIPAMFAAGLTLTSIATGVASVMRNSTTDDLESLIKAGSSLPLCAQAHTLRSHLSACEDNSERLALIERWLRELASQVETGIADHSVWTNNQFHMPLLLALVGEYGTEPPRTLVTDALTEDTSLAKFIITALAQWTEHRDNHTGQVVGAGCKIVPEQMPSWLPATEIAAAVVDEFPTITPTPPLWNPVGSDPSRLAAEFLHYFGPAPTDRTPNSPAAQGS